MTSVATGVKFIDSCTNVLSTILLRILIICHILLSFKLSALAKTRQENVEPLKIFRWNLRVNITYSLVNLTLDYHICFDEISPWGSVNGRVTLASDLRHNPTLIIDPLSHLLDWNRTCLCDITKHAPALRQRNGKRILKKREYKKKYMYVIFFFLLL